MVRNAWNGIVHGRTAALLGVIALGGSLAGCSGSDKPAKAAPPGTPGAAPSSASPPPTTHPFTGGRSGLKNPVLAVKIENTRNAMPQSGVSAADIVYIEQVEGGETRLMAVYSSKLPRRVGPVRSARISDMHILPQFGRPAFAFSGVQPKMKKYIRKSPVYDISQDNGGSSYVRWGPKPIPYNLYADPKDLLKQAPKATGPRDIGFRFGPAPAGGRPMKSFTARWPAVRMGFTWSAKQKRWLASYNGSPDVAREGGRLGGQTVVIQYAKTGRSQFRDVLGAYTPLIKTTGTGRALVLRDGKAYDAKWSRPSEEKGTTFTTADGKPMTFAPGQVWVALVNDGKPYMP
ncbi:DUF3048 domain-containing protein [Actinomadura rudentiformis]|uniref:DUF3048 domain-containing protein n=1 Tax=Actinomadura rudentiformis TaxID=359158 RepID=A0A6H9YJF5_9ACTN|nr:DUF3048 domain-containing protein [Actinomadura rudentiformis]KAB2341070.1 DUF3048 domain-containing protein [Actinomadura rudentiformis]